MNILFPRHELYLHAPDEMFELEYNAAQTLGLKTFLFNHDKFVDEGALSCDIPNSEVPQAIMLRGYMLKAKQYEVFAGLLSEKNYFLINDASRYKRCHHSHETHHIFGDYAPKIIAVPNLTRDLFDRIFTTESAQFNLEQIQKDFKSDYFILKDSVKSEKDNPEIFKISKNIYPKEFYTKLKKFVEARGKSYNDGLVFKEFVELKKYPGDKANEWRAFYLENKLVSLSQNSGLNAVKIPKPDTKWLDQFARVILSNFFTIDVAEKEDGTWVVIETGDGQVSGLSPGQNELKFYSEIKKITKLEIVPNYE